MASDPPPSPSKPRRIRLAALPWTRAGLVMGVVVGAASIPCLPEGLRQPWPVRLSDSHADRGAHPDDDTAFYTRAVPQTGRDLFNDDGSIRGPAVIHVWLEGCRDCLPALEAWKRLSDLDALRGIPVWSVSYGPASAAFVERYALGERYVVDTDGSRVVQPFFIGTFTTLVVNAHGKEVHRDRPENPGYVERVRSVWAQLARGESNPVIAP